MIYKVSPSKISGTVAIPGSKSHTIRALVIAALASGTSEIHVPLDSSDTRSCVDMIEGFGAKVEMFPELWKVTGIGDSLEAPENIIDVGNSGTTLYIGMGMASLIKGYTVFTGDHQIRNRPADALIQCINDLGGKAFSTKGNDKPPLVIGGPVKGGKTSVEAVTSQYLSALLMAAPLAENQTIIEVPLLNEKPYVTMTLGWLDRQGITYKNNNYESFEIPGKQSYKAFKEAIAADFSSATFFLVAGAIGGDLILNGLDFEDTQGDKEVVNILKQMGADIKVEKSSISIKGGQLHGGTFDLNAIPDALPALSVAACFAEGETRLINVPQARVKETDRIAVMCQELKKLGADIEELPDGLIIRKSKLTGGVVHGHHDHRVVMSLSVAGLFAQDVVEIDTAEAVSITFPTFRNLIEQCNGIIENLQ